jgi:FkbM family methyltransferase
MIIDYNNFKTFEIPENIKHVKIDIGLGEQNVHSNTWLVDENDVYILAFDPNPDSINSCIPFIQQQLSRPNNNTMRIIPAALSNVEKPVIKKFYKMQKDAGTSSLLEPTANRLGPIKEIIDVGCFSLEYFLNFFPWDRFEYIEYIKIDAQGEDLEIIKSIGKYLDRIVYITAEPEFNDYKNSENNTEINMEKFMIEKGFIKIKHSNINDPTFINKKYYHLKDIIYISFNKYF